MGNMDGHSRRTPPRKRTPAANAARRKACRTLAAIAGVALATAAAAAVLFLPGPWLKTYAPAATSVSPVFTGGGTSHAEAPVTSLLLGSTGAAGKPAAPTPPPVSPPAEAGQLLTAFAWDSGTTPATALARDLATHILAENGAPAGNGRVQLCAIRTMNGTENGRVVCAALASVLADGQAPTAPRLFIVDAVYRQGDGETPGMRLNSWTIRPVTRLDQDEFPELQYRGPDDALLALYETLNGELALHGAAPISPDLSEGTTVRLSGAAGKLRWYRLSLWVLQEAGAGTSNVDVSTADLSGAGAMAGSLAVLSGKGWARIPEKEYEDITRRGDGPGLQSVMLELHLAADGGLWTYTYLLNTKSETVALSRSLSPSGGAEARYECYASQDKALYGAMIAALHINTDVSDMLIAGGPRFTLPLSRDELVHLVAFVQDMPGGIAAIHASILYNGATKAEEVKTISKQKAVVGFAETVGKLLGGSDWVGKGTLVQTDALPADMAAHGADGTPALVRWDFDVAAQEGQAALTFFANPVTGQVWSETTYRLFGTQDVNKRYMAVKEGDRSLYRLLTKLTFGREMNEPADLPR